MHLVQRLTLVACLASTALPALSMVGVGEAAARADERPIDIGTELIATSDVTLHQAEICKGSRVSVIKLNRSGVQVDAVNVALADGHVVKMTIAQVHTFFRVAEE